MADLSTILRPAMGLLMIFGPYLALRRRRIGARRAAREFPALAEALGLTFRAPSDGKRIGTLSGSLDGHDVFVDPDERPRIVVYFRKAPELILRTYLHEKRIPAGMQRFDTRVGSVDAFFKERLASTAAADALLLDSSGLERAVAPFAEPGPLKISHVSITPERLECAFDVGRPPHIPPEVVEALLPKAVALVRWLEAAGGVSASA